MVFWTVFGAVVFWAMLGAVVSRANIVSPVLAVIASKALGIVVSGTCLSTDRECQQPSNK